MTDVIAPGSESTINAVVERITFHNEENGFTVLKAKIPKNKGLTTIIATIQKIHAGENIIASGKWHNDSKFGLQFKAETISAILPNTINGITKYLSSGLIKGVGIHYAKKIVDIFGIDTIDIIENHPDKLTSINGIGRQRANIISQSWLSNKVVRDIMIFLQSHGVSSSLANKIFRYYGPQAIDIVKENPYRLAKDMKGVGFLSADKIAINMGVDPHSIQRAQAAILYLLNEAEGSGHCCLPRHLLLEKGCKSLLISESVLNDALAIELENRSVISFSTITNDKDNSTNQDLTQNHTTDLLYSNKMLQYELYISRKLSALTRIGQAINSSSINTDNATQWLFDHYGIKLSSSQKEAISIITRNKVSIITGGPGTGKTTLVNALLKILTEYFETSKELKIKLAAPTGRAAKRLSESTRRYATTIHRMLEFEPQHGGFKYHKDNNMPCDILIIDESSMIDVKLMQVLLQALDNDTHIIFVGDADQIPSVGPGQILLDMIESQTIPVVKLKKIFRQVANSDIITNAHLINKGFMPKLNESRSRDFWFYNIDDAETAMERIKTILTHDIPQMLLNNVIPKIKHQQKDDINKIVQILSPMQKGNMGVKSMNIELKKILNPHYNEQETISRYGISYSANDKVIQVENNYNKLVFNGDIGYIQSIDKTNQEIIISFYNREVRYDFDEMDQVQLAYAITIHKSQGSEYPIVILPVLTQHFIMLNKNLLYTAITRAKGLVIAVGQKRAFAMAIKSPSNDRRYSKLKDFLLEYSNLGSSSE